MEGIVTAGLFHESYVVESRQQVMCNDKKLYHCKENSGEFQQTPVKLLTSVLKVYFNKKYKNT